MSRRILGIDPGSRLMGYGCVEVWGNRVQVIGSGTIQLQAQTSSFSERLLRLHQGLTQIIQEMKPHVMVVERVFFAKNASSVIKLGQARGVVLLCGAQNSMELFEYTPAEVKQTLAGNGRATKEQVAKMVSLLTGVQHFKTLDASDALSLAICHGFLSTNPIYQESQKPFRSVDGNPKA